MTGLHNQQVKKGKNHTHRLGGSRPSPDPAFLSVGRSLRTALPHGATELPAALELSQQDHPLSCTCRPRPSPSHTARDGTEQQGAAPAPGDTRQAPSSKPVPACDSQCKAGGGGHAAPGPTRAARRTPPGMAQQGALLPLPLPHTLPRAHPHSRQPGCTDPQTSPATAPDPPHLPDTGAKVDGSHLNDITNDDTP